MRRRLSMGKAVGLFFDNGNVKAAEVSGSARRMRISRVLRETMTSNDELSAGENLGNFFDRNGLGRENVVLCLSGGDSVLRRVTLPLSNASQIERTVKFQAEKFVVDRSLEDIIVDYFVVGQSKSETEIFLLAVKKEELRKKLEILGHAGISPVGVTLDSVALFNLVAAAGAFPREGASALLEFSSNVCRIILARQGRLIFLRAINITGSRPGELGDMVARELKNSCIIAGVNEPLANVLVAGDEAEGSTYQTLGRRLAVDVGTFNPFTAFPSDTTEEENGGSDDLAAIALGAALKGIRAESVPVDLQKEEFALRSGFDFVRKKLTYLFAVLAILFGLLCAQSYYDAAEKRSYLNKIEDEARGYWKAVFPQKPFPSNTFDKWIKSSTAKRKSGERTGPRYRSFLETIREIAAVLPAQKATAIRSISFDQKHVVLAGDTEDFGQFEMLVGALRALPGYKIKEKFEKRGRPERQQRLLFSIEMIPAGEAK